MNIKTEQVTLLRFFAWQGKEYLVKCIDKFIFFNRNLYKMTISL